MKPQTGAVHTTPQATPGRPDVAVVYTEVKPTLAALRRAALLADGLHARIRLVVLQVVPYPLPLDCPSVAESVSTRRLRTLIPDSSIETMIDLRLCRDRNTGLAGALERESIVVLGTRKRRWLRTQEERLACLLEEQGHEVILIRC